MRLEGTLDAFSLPDIFQLLSFTKKTGTLHLRRGSCHGVVHVRDGAVTGARSDAGRQALGRRIVGAGLVDDDVLEEAVSVVAAGELPGLATALARIGNVDEGALRDLAVEHATDSVFDLLRWPDGEFAFVVDEADPDDLGAVLSVEDVVTEARRRLDVWPSLTEAVPAPEAVVSVTPAPDDAVLTRDEWALLSLVDGRRTVADLVVLAGRGEYAVVAALSALVERGLLTATVEAAPDAVRRRQELLASLEGDHLPDLPPVGEAQVREEPPAPVAKAPAAREPEPVVESAPAADRTPVIPERPEPFTPQRRPDHVEEFPAYARTSHTPTQPAASVGAVHGSAAMQPEISPAEAAPTPSSLIERDPNVNKSLLLRLIAGVRGL